MTTLLAVAGLFMILAALFGLGIFFAIDPVLIVSTATFFCGTLAGACLSTWLTARRDTLVDMAGERRAAQVRRRPPRPIILPPDFEQWEAEGYPPAPRPNHEVQPTKAWPR